MLYRPQDRPLSDYRYLCRYEFINAIFYKQRRTTMWTKPAATEMRFGFEVTMYVMNK